MYIIFKENLGKIFGRDDVGLESSERVGINARNCRQKNVNGKLISIFEITDIKKVDKYKDKIENEIVNKEEANNFIDKNFTLYSVKNEGLMVANIAKKNIDLDEMSAEWSAQEELTFLFNKNVSGIQKTETKHF